MANSSIDTVFQMFISLGLYSPTVKGHCRTITLNYTRTNKLCKAGNVFTASLMSKGESGGQQCPDTEAKAVIELIDYRH